MIRLTFLKDHTEVVEPEVKISTRDVVQVRELRPHW